MRLKVMWGRVNSGMLAAGSQRIVRFTVGILAFILADILAMIVCYWLVGQSAFPSKMAILFAWTQWRYGGRGRTWRESQLSVFELACVVAASAFVLAPVDLFVDYHHPSLGQVLAMAAVDGLFAATLYISLNRIWPDGLQNAPTR